ncbi:glycosyltransferase family 4 protein [Kaistella haifensis]|nr:glycosyltransferase family 4 protein [Kaistella haifensis]
MKSKKILFIYYQNIKQNGVSRVLANLVSELADEGFEIEILFLMAPHEDFYPINPKIKKHYVDSFADSYTRLGTKIVKKYTFIPKYYNIYSYLYDIGSYRVLKAWLKENHHNYDKIITCWYKLSSMLSLDKDLSKKTIAWEHISFETGGLFWFKTLRKYYRNLQGVVAINKAGYDFYKTINPNTHIIYNTVGEPFEKTDYIKPDKKENIIAFAGRLEYDKNTSAFVDIIHKANIPDDWRIIIAGDGSERQKLENKVRENKIKNIEFVGRQNTTEIYELFKKSKIFCLTSRIEGLGMVLIEAMFCSNALISYDCHYGPSDIVNSENGFLIPLNKEKMFIEKLNILVSDKNKLNQLMESAYQESNHWKKEKIIEQWKKII